ncbi:TlpA family protein disulfide reductase [Methyloprofundus sp.]|uniref:TlpA family protein disulfide reductase n=1 Tax=Methyloprofundus sp. TaxID=2020875 RepID=UPI003D12202C
MNLNKKKSKRWITLSSIVLVAIVFYAWQLKAKTAPDVQFKTISNKTLELKQLQGKVVLITFWASNCPSCRKEIPEFKSLYKNYHQQGLEIIAIAMHYDRPNHVVNLSREYQIPYDIVLDLQMHLAKAFGDISLIPTTLLINPQGEIVYQTTGVFDIVAMKKRIELLLPPKL